MVKWVRSGKEQWSVLSGLPCLVNGRKVQTYLFSIVGERRVRVKRKGTKEYSSPTKLSGWFLVFDPLFEWDKGWSSTFILQVEVYCTHCCLHSYTTHSFLGVLWTSSMKVWLSITLHKRTGNPIGKRETVIRPKIWSLIRFHFVENFLTREL